MTKNSKTAVVAKPFLYKTETETKQFSLMVASAVRRTSQNKKMDKYEGRQTGTAQRILETGLLAADLIVNLVRIIFHVIYAIYELIAPPQERSVVGEIVLITGTGHGIGKELAKQYGELGAQVICVDLNPDTNETTVTELKKLGIKAHAYTCDVCSRENVLKLSKAVQSEVGDVSILVNNAGIMPCKKFLTHSPEAIKKIFDVNVFAHFWMLEAFLPAMIKKNKGHVVGISSIVGLVGSPNIVPYCASKFAVRGLMEGLIEEFRLDRNNKIQFTTIYPYITDTGLCQKPRIKFKSFLRMQTPEETARVIVRAQRRGYKESTAPEFLLYSNNLTRLLPRSCYNLIIDFLDAKLDEHD